VGAVIEAGVDVVRLNFAHDRPSTHRRAAETARRQASNRGHTIGVLVDLPGPKMRTGPVVDGVVTVVQGGELMLTPRRLEGDAERVSTTVEGLERMVSEGDSIFLADGEIVLEVTKKTGGDVHTTVVRGGELSSGKGMHVPGADRDVEAFTQADRDALEAGVRLDADLIGLSFVRDANDIERARAAIPKRGRRPLMVAKIETRSAVDNLDEIIACADAVMVARGDLGIQTDLRGVPLLQKDIIGACNRAGVPVITATQMLESMTHSPLPTRAEVADVANAVIDGTDALMLSEETAIGDDPEQVVRLMGDVAERAEVRRRTANFPRPDEQSDERVSWAVARAAVHAAEDVSVAAILCPTLTGATPRRVAAFRPTMRVIGLSGVPETIGGLSLSWGVMPLPVTWTHAARDAREEVQRSARACRESSLVEPGELVAVVCGGPGRRAGRTDLVRIARV
jgi:pyruvate kinase